MALSVLTLDTDGRYFICTADRVTDRVNIRSGASTSDGIIGHLYVGDYLQMQKKAYNDGTYRWYGVLTIDGKIGYIRGDYVKTVYLKNTEPTTAQTQSIIDALVASDKDVYNNLLICASLLEVQKKNGCNVSSCLSKFNTLNERLAERQNALRENSIFHNVKTVVSSIWNSAKNSYNAVLSYISGIGVLPVAIYAIVAGVSLVIGAVSSLAIYYAFKPKYDQSTVDLKQTKELKEALEKLSPEKAQKVVEDLEKQIDDAYNNGKTDGSFSGIWNVAKYVVVGIGGFYLVSQFLKSNK